MRGGASVEVEVTVDPPRPDRRRRARAAGTPWRWRYAAITEPNLTFDALLPMLRARTVAELDEAKRPWVDPDNNFVMADTSGTIGYLTRGQIPIRPTANAWLPVPGWTGEYEWQGTGPVRRDATRPQPRAGFHCHRQPADRRAGLPPLHLARLLAAVPSRCGSTPGCVR